MGDSPKIDPPEDGSVKRMRTSVTWSGADDGESKTKQMLVRAVSLKYSHRNNYIQSTKANDGESKT